jgi:hypothetical protein
MLASASIVSRALIGQVTRFDRRFITFALVLLGMVVVIGALTQMRVAKASVEDLAHVIGMNRLRAACVELNPGIERYLVTSAHDDHNGLWQTYNHLAGPNPMLQPLTGSGMFIAFLNSGLTGVVAALVAMALDEPGPLVGVVAAACGLSFLGTSVAQGFRRYERIQRHYVALFPASDRPWTTRSRRHSTKERIVGVHTTSSSWAAGYTPRRRNAAGACTTASTRAACVLNGNRTIAVQHTAIYDGELQRAAGNRGRTSKLDKTASSASPSARATHRSRSMRHVTLVGRAPALAQNDNGPQLQVSA